MDDKEKRGLGQGIGYTVSGILGIVAGIYGGPKAGSAITNVGTTITDVSIEAAVPTKQEVPTGQVAAKSPLDLGMKSIGTVSKVEQDHIFLDIGPGKRLEIGSRVYAKYGDFATVIESPPDNRTIAKITPGVEWVAGQTVYAKESQNG